VVCVVEFAGWNLSHGRIVLIVAAVAAVGVRAHFVVDAVVEILGSSTGTGAAVVLAVVAVVAVVPSQFVASIPGIRLPASFMPSRQAAPPRAGVHDPPS